MDSMICVYTQNIESYLSQVQFCIKMIKGVTGKDLEDFFCGCMLKDNKCSNLQITPNLLKGYYLNYFLSKYK